MCQWHMSSTDRSGEVGVHSTEQSVSIKVGAFCHGIIKLP